MKGRLVAVLAMAVLLAALVAQTDRLRDRLRAERIVKVVEAATQQLMAAGRVPPRMLWRHVRLLEEAGRLAPGEAAIPLAQGAQYMLLDRPQEAVAVYRRALALEVRPETYLNLGRAQLRLDDEPSALESFRRAVRLDPRLRREVPRPLRRRLGS